MSTVATRMGFSPTRRMGKYWEKWNNVEQAVREFIAKYGHFPIGRELSAVGRSHLVSVMSKYHGGFAAVRARMGYGQGGHPPGYWKKWANVEKAIRTYVASNGHFPTHKDLVSTKESSLAASMIMYHGGFAAVRARMGYGQGGHPPGYWKKWANVEKAIKANASKHRRFPTCKSLSADGLSGLAGAISKHHGGFFGC